MAGAMWAEKRVKREGTSHVLYTQLPALHEDAEHGLQASLIISSSRPLFSPRTPRCYSFKKLGTLRKVYYYTYLVTLSQQILRTKSRQAIIALQNPQSGSTFWYT